MSERILKKGALPDAAERYRIETDLGRNFLVEAGAGSGKTTSLVARMIALLAAGLAEPDSLVAVTFTRKAASQLRQRFQEMLEERLGAEREPAVKERLERAQRGLDLVRVGTIHSFCASLLRERPVEAGIDLGLSDVKLQEAVLFQPLAWREWIAECAEKDDPRLAALEETGLKAQDLENAFLTLAEYPDVLPVVADPPPPRPALDGVRRKTALLLSEADPLKPGEPLAGKEPDALQSALVRVKRLLGQPDAESDDGFVRVLEELEPDKLAEIKATQWEGGKAAAQAFLGRFEDFREEVLLPALLAWREWVHPRAMGFLVPALERLRTRRREEGFLTYEDLLLISRDVLRDQPAVRRYFRSRVSHLLVDEFQDTDPLQAEVMLFLTSEDDRQRNAWKLRPKAGSLFVVGDPKQSIYRFRRADIETYETFTEIVKASGGEVLRLTSSFRTVDAAAAPVNRTFSGILPKEPTRLQAAFAPVNARGAESGPTCGAFRLPSRGDGNFREGRVRSQNAQDIAAFVRHAVAGGWKIPGPGGAPVTPRPSDILVLTVGRDALAEYAQALETAGVPVEVTGSRAFAITKGLLALQPLLAAVNDPDDEVAVVAFLSGPLCGVDDDALFRHRRAGRRFAFTSDPEPGTDPKIARGLALLRDAQHDSRAFPPAAALVNVVERLGLAASISAEEGGRTATGNLLKVLAWARRLSADGHSFSDVARRLVEEAPELEEMSVDAARSNAVRLMNVHKAKGLEAPLVVLAEPVDRPEREPGSHIERTGDEPRGWFPVLKPLGERGVRVLALPPDWAEKGRVERTFLDAERDRLFYVGATRAMFTLVASIHTKVTRKNGPQLTGLWAPLDPHLSALPTGPVPVPAAPGHELPALARELPEVRRRIAAARERAVAPSYGVVTVTALAKREGPRAPTPAQEAHGTAWGRILHRLLESAMRTPGVDLRALAANLMREEDVSPELLDEVLRVAASVTSSDLWTRARRATRRFVEVPFEMVVPSKDLGEGAGGPDETLLKGALDLVFEEDGVWHVVDWKSDVVGGGLDALVAHYAPQVEHYRRAWESLTGQKAKAGLFFMDTGDLVWLGEDEKREEEISLKVNRAGGEAGAPRTGAKPRQGSLFDE